MSVCWGKWLKAGAAKLGDDEPVLYQWITKEHIGDDMSDDDWERFVVDTNDAFADDVSELARDYLRRWQRSEKRQ